MAKQQTEAAPEATAKERKTITVDFTDHPEVFEKITKAAAEDERSAATYLRRLIVKQFNV